jgi:hypothetical protein
MCPEWAAVLPHPPAFVLETTFRGRCGQRTLRQSGVTIFRAVEAGEVFAEDLFLAVAL